MRTIIVVALIIALALVIVGAADRSTHVDVGYLFGTWHQASLFALFAIAAGLVLIAGLVGMVVAPLSAARSRRTLEAELEGTYLRLRAAESGAVVAAPAALTGPSAKPSLSVAAGPAPEPSVAEERESAEAERGEEADAASSADDAVAAAEAPVPDPAKPDGSSADAAPADAEPPAAESSPSPAVATADESDAGPA